MLAVTLKQIAEACNVSTATVSKALNYASDIGAEKAESIRRTAKSMGYFPNAAARALKTNHSRNIGVTFSLDRAIGLTHEYFAQILESFQLEAETSGYDLTLISRSLGKTVMSYLEHSIYRNCDGIFVLAQKFEDPSIIELVSSKIPLVTIDYAFNGCSAVSSDNVNNMSGLVRYVHSLGHRKIAFIYGDKIDVTTRRIEGFYKTCGELGLSIPHDYVVEGVYHCPETSAAATRKLMSLTDRPTCIMYPDDYSYIGGMNELDRLGFSIPEDISVTGFDGISLSKGLRPNLTTFHQDSGAIGKKAAQLLVSAIEQPDKYKFEHVIIPGTVWEGGTVKKQ
ncbi:MAG: LacI family DNA-binding transcriptional regulator [Spirochaetales bacterium]|nr:LacI family DNA-binding transcriptional regulator [Spirochaetales bacterium]